MTDRERIAKLKKYLDPIQDKLRDLAIEVSMSKEVSNIYWSSMGKKARDLYFQAQAIYMGWVKTNSKNAFDEEIRKQISEIKQMAFTPQKTVNFKDFINSDTVKQIAGSVISNTSADFIIGLTAGEKRLNRLLRVTQQVNITEKRLEQAISKGFDEKKSIYGAQKKLQKELLTDATNNKFVTVIDKNGQTRNYDIKYYAEMVARTQLAQMQSDGTVNLAIAYGSDLVRVSAHNTETEYDAQFEGRIFSLSGTDPDFPPAIDLPPFHPNCRHRITVFFKEAQPEEALQKLSDYSLGKTDKHPYRKGLLPNDDIKGRKKLAKEKK